ncbi:MAG: PPC domain-containing protein [Pseudomonadota bacterium]
MPTLCGLVFVLGGSCAPPPCCRGDLDCAEGYACTGGQCRPRCRFEGQCSLGQRCDVERGVCVGGTQRLACTVDDAGPGDGPAVESGRDVGTVDVRGDSGRLDVTGVDLPATDRGPGDGGGSDLSGRDLVRRDVGTGDVTDWDKPPEEGGGDGPAVCTDDIFENNDDRQHAASITSAPFDAVLCPGDPDFFIVDRGMNAIVRATLRCPDAPVPISLILRLPGGVRLARTCLSSTGEVTANLSVPEPGPATVELSAGGAEPVPYNLQVEVEGTQPPCGTDPFEPNNSAADAFVVRHGSSLNAATCSEDPDFFAVVMMMGTTLSVRQDVGTPCAGDRLTLLGPNGTTVLADDVSAASQRVVSSSVTQSGTYYVQVLSGCTENSYYALRVGDSSCADDSLEDNDSLGQASSVVPSRIDGAICRGDDDYLAFDAIQGTPLRLDLRFSHSSGDLDLALFDPVARRVGLAQGVGDEEVVQYTASQSGRYTARVYGFNGAEAPYSLDICLDDPWEENDSIDRAVDLPGRNLRGVLCRGDVDHFSVDLVVPSVLRATFVPEQGLAASRLSLVRARDGAEVAAAVVLSDGQHLEYIPDENARFVLVVQGPPETTLYDLQVVIQQD